jgi:hypothetical protein
MASDAPPEPLNQMPRPIRRAFDGETVQLSRDMRLSLKRHEDLAGGIIGSVVFEMAMSKLLRTGSGATACDRRDEEMKDSAKYAKIVEDHCYVGSAPGLILGEATELTRKKSSTSCAKSSRSD